MQNLNTIKKELNNLFTNYLLSEQTIALQAANLDSTKVQSDNIKRKLQHLLATNKPSFLITQSEPDRLCFYLGDNTIVIIENEQPIDIQIFTNTEFIDLSPQSNEGVIHG